jgi:hypothetical protein
MMPDEMATPEEIDKILEEVLGQHPYEQESVKRRIVRSLTNKQSLGASLIALKRTVPLLREGKINAIECWLCAKAAMAHAEEQDERTFLCSIDLDSAGEPTEPDSVAADPIALLGECQIVEDLRRLRAMLPDTRDAQLVQRLVGHLRQLHLWPW